MSDNGLDYTIQELDEDGAERESVEVRAAVKSCGRGTDGGQAQIDAAERRSPRCNHYEYCESGTECD